MMLSDERIRDIAADYWENCDGLEDLEQAIRAALAEAAQSPAVPVVGSPVAWTSPEWLKEKGKLHGMTRRHPSFKVPLYRAPANRITQAELDAKDARISELEFVIEEIIRINHYDFRGHEIAHAAIAKERQS